MARIKAILDESDCRGDWLTLEVTEDHMMVNPDKCLEVMREVRDLGVRISMDDFGTGYSSLSLLKRFPIDELKIDRGFVQDLPHMTEMPPPSSALSC